jgi:hypothetical protein
MTATIHRLPTALRPVPQEPEEDAAVAMLKAIDRCEKKIGKHVTAIVIARRFQLADQIANTFGWRQRARAMFDHKETV